MSKAQRCRSMLLAKRKDFVTDDSIQIDDSSGEKSCFCLDIQQDLFYIFFVYTLIIIDLHLLVDDIFIT